MLASLFFGMRCSKEEPNEIIINYSKPSIKKKSIPSINKNIDEIVITDYDCRLLPSPSSNNAIIRIPKNTELKVLDSKDVQQGRMLNKWYKVEYKGQVGWTSSFNMKSPPEPRVSSVDEMMSNYEKVLGKAPTNNPLTSKIPEIDNWLKKNKNNYKTIVYKSV